jgi:hypothetical protein
VGGAARRPQYRGRGCDSSLNTVGIASSF